MSTKLNIKRIQYKIRGAWYRLRYWVTDSLPALCPVCHKWSATGTFHMAQHSVAGDVGICDKCYRELFPGGEE